MVVAIPVVQILLVLFPNDHYMCFKYLHEIYKNLNDQNRNLIKNSKLQTQNACNYINHTNNSIKCPYLELDQNTT